MRPGVRDRPGQHGKTPSLLKIPKISQAQWLASVMPATWIAEAWELLEPGRWRLQWAEIAPLHSSLGKRARHCLKKQKKEVPIPCLPSCDSTDLRTSLDMACGDPWSRPDNGEMILLLYYLWNNNFVKRTSFLIYSFNAEDAAGAVFYRSIAEVASSLLHRI